jgi:formate-dependent nitrite reductase membrane component NrfD
MISKQRMVKRNFRTVSHDGIDGFVFLIGILGCGLISPRFSKLLSKEKRIIFHEARYRPSVYQIRYEFVSSFCVFPTYSFPIRYRGYKVPNSTK